MIKIRNGVVVILALGMLVGCGGGGAEAAPTFVLPTARPTEAATTGFLTRPTYTVTAGTLREEVTVRGELVAAEQAQLFFTVSGVLREVNVAPGDEVAADAVLAALNAPSLEQEVVQRAANLRLAELELARVEARAPSTVTLTATSPVTFELAMARERLSLAEALCAHAEAQLAATVLRAPFAGTVTSFNKQQGGRVDPYEVVGVVADLAAVEVRAMVPADAVGAVSEGMPAEIRLDGYPSTPFTGAVATVAETPVAWQGELAHTMTLAVNAGQALPPVVQVGAEVTLLGEVREAVAWVPESALITLGEQVFVDLLRSSEIERVPVETGIRTGQQVEIVSGVAVGEKVVFP